MGSVKFRTETGSVYEIFEEDGSWCWARLGEPDFEGYFRLRTKTGKLSMRPDVQVGQEVEMIGPPLMAGDFRMVKTSRVVEILDGE